MSRSLVTKRREYLPDLQTVGAAVVLAMTLYLVGAFVQKLTGFPGPVTMLFLAVAIKLGRLVSPELEQGAFRNYQFFAKLVTYPLLFAIGVAKTPWEKLMSAFTAPEFHDFRHRRHARGRPASSLAAWSISIRSKPGSLPRVARARAEQVTLRSSPRATG